MQNNLEPNPALIADEFHKTLTLAENHVEQQQQQYDDPDDDNHDYTNDHDGDGDDDDDDEDDDGDFEFSFAGSEMTSPISADEVFQNGQIRPIYPFSDDLAENSGEATTSYGGPPVKKLFVVDSNDVVEGPYCNWPPENLSPEKKSPAPEMSRKSNSTGFSKLWKVKDYLLVRSHSDGKDAFVFLNGKNDQTTSSSGVEGDLKKKVGGIKLKEGETTSSGKKKKSKSAYEVLYGKREKKAGKSYLPYRQDLVGFFTNSNGITRNVHPY